MAGLALLITARSLEPDPRGFGTHEQLGLIPCCFHRWTGRVCPTCGATTALAHALRGNIADAATANLGGALLRGMTVLGIPWMLTSAAVDRWFVV